MAIKLELSKIYQKFMITAVREKIRQFWQNSCKAYGGESAIGWGDRPPSVGDPQSRSISPELSINHSEVIGLGSSL